MPKWEVRRKDPGKGIKARIISDINGSRIESRNKSDKKTYNRYSIRSFIQSAIANPNVKNNLNAILAYLRQRGCTINYTNEQMRRVEKIIIEELKEEGIAVEEEKGRNDDDDER